MSSSEVESNALFVWQFVRACRDSDEDFEQFVFRERLREVKFYPVMSAFHFDLGIRAA